MQILFMMLAGFMLTVLLTPASIKIAVVLHAIDQPGELSIHASPTPRFGGLGIFFSLVLLLLLFPGVHHFMPLAARLFLGTALLTIFLIGAVDDIKSLKATSKLLLQLVGTSLAAIGLYRVYAPPMLPLILVALFIWVYTNSFNLIDGMDGLASGLAFIMAFALAVVALMAQNSFVLLVSMLVAGCCIGFLLFNLNPAKIFLGDSGSTLLGFLLALLAAMLWLGSETRISFLPLVLILAVPLMDTAAAFFRRIRRHTSIFSGDRHHLYDVLLQRGFTVNQTLFVFYSAAAVSALFGVLFFLWLIY